MNPLEHSAKTPSETVAILRHLDGWPVQSHSCKKVQEAIDAAIEMIERLEAAEKELAELRSSMKFRTSLIGRTEAERDALRVENETLSANLRGKHSTAGATYAHLIAERYALRAALQHETDCVEAAKAKIEALRSKIEAIEKQEPFDADSDVFRGAFEAALKAGNWPATRQGDGYRSPSTQIAWRIAFSTVNRLKLYLAPVAQGE